MVLPAPRADLQALRGYHSPQYDVNVRLNTNEAPEPPPAAFSEAVAEAVTSVRWNRYPDRAASELRAGIARLHGLFRSTVFVANGSNEVLQTVLLTYAGSSRSVMTFEPTYALHKHISRIVGAEINSEARLPDFTIDRDAATQAIVRQKPAVVFVCSPNNPTGTVEPLETIVAILAAASSYGGLVVVDEAYGQFAPYSAVPMVADHDNLVVTRTFSKTWAMAAARLGYVVAPPAVVTELEKVVLPYHLDVVTQVAGVAALEFVDQMDHRVGHIVAERERLHVELQQLGCQVWPSGANFILFRPPNGDGSDVWEDLLKHSVMVRNTASWPGLGGSLRVTVGTAVENNLFLEALALVLADRPEPTQLS